MSLIVGIDEAGRGPVIGPLIITGVLIEEKDSKKLKKEGIKDSKLLTQKKRVLLYKKIKKIAKKINIIKIDPKEIDEALESEELNLNWLEAVKSAEIINKLKPQKVILDCPSPNKEKYKNYVKKLLKNKDIEIISEHKADVKFPVCSAAGIVSKCIREEEIAKLKKKYGDFGPGYPSNQITQKFLKENWNKHPEIFRKSWISWKKHRDAKDQKNLGEFS